MSTKQSRMIEAILIVIIILGLIFLGLKAYEMWWKPKEPLIIDFKPVQETIHHESNSEKEMLEKQKAELLAKIDALQKKLDEENQAHHSEMEDYFEKTWVMLMETTEMCKPKPRKKIAAPIVIPPAPVEKKAEVKPEPVPTPPPAPEPIIVEKLVTRCEDSDAVKTCISDNYSFWDSFCKPNVTPSQVKSKFISNEEKISNEITEREEGVLVKVVPEKSTPSNEEICKVSRDEIPRWCEKQFCP